MLCQLRFLYDLDRRDRESKPRGGQLREQFLFAQMPENQVGYHRNPVRYVHVSPAGALLPGGRCHDSQRLRQHGILRVYGAGILQLLLRVPHSQRDQRHRYGWKHLGCSLTWTSHRHSLGTSPNVFPNLVFFAEPIGNGDRPGISRSR